MANLNLDQQRRDAVIREYFKLVAPGLSAEVSEWNDTQELQIRVSYSAMREGTIAMEESHHSEAFGRLLNSMAEDIKQELMDVCLLQQVVDKKVADEVKRSVEQAKAGWIEEGYRRAIAAFGEAVRTV